MNSEDVAVAYQIRRQSLQELRQRHNLSAEDVADPDVVFSRLLDSGRRSPLRTRLTNPATRAAIREELNLAAIRSHAPSAGSKISSIH